MSQEQYLDMCEQMGWIPTEEELPVDASTLSINAQSALLLINALPDIWEGMNGSWLGKDYSGLFSIMEIYEMEDKRAIFELLKAAENELGIYYAQKRKEQETISKPKRAR